MHQPTSTRYEATKMVTTFSARLQSLTTKCIPLLGKRTAEYTDPSPSYKHPKTTATTTTMKRCATTTSSHHISDTNNNISTHSHPTHAQSTANKRRKHKEELQYTAHTIQSALREAGRPPITIFTRRRERALPMGSVNMNLALVVSSKEYDAMESNGSTASNESTTEEDTSDVPEANVYDYTSPYEYASLMQASRTYYTSSSTSNVSGTTTTTASTEEDKTNKSSEYNEDKTSEHSSEGLSSWTPNSSCEDFDEDKKNNSIDNDNRSDGQSSLGAEDSSSSSSSGGGFSSSPSPSLKEENNTEGGATVDAVTEGEKKETDENGAYSVVG
jgi:hypothetical protein